MHENVNISVPRPVQGRYLVGISGTQVLRQIDSEQFPKKWTPVDSEEEEKKEKNREKKEYGIEKRDDTENCKGSTSEVCITILSLLLPCLESTSLTCLITVHFLQLNFDK